MSLSFGLSPFGLLLCLLAAAALTFWAYQRTVPALSPGRRAVLMGLRFAALFVLLALLFQPLLRRTTEEAQPPRLAVLVDTSLSLSLDAEGEAAGADVPASVRAVLRGLPEDGPARAARFYAFSGEVAPRPAADPAWVDSLAFTGPRTNIARALEYVREDLKNDNLRGVVLISDGRYNTGRNPLYVAERYPVPIYAVVVGDTTQRRDVQVRRVTTNELAYVGTELPVQVGLRADAYAGETVTVSLLRGGGVLAQQRVQLPAGSAEIPVDLAVTPAEEGLLRLTVAVSRLPGEATYRNNTESVTVRVLRSKRRVLLLAAAPSPDLSAVRQLLEEDANAEVQPFVQKGPGTFYEGALPASFQAYDLIALVGYPGRGADAATVQRVAAAAEAGTPLFFMFSQQTDLNLLRQHLGGVLPAVPATVRPGFSEALVVPTPAGRQHPLLSVPGAPAAGWQALPPLLVSESRWQTSPDARVLATAEVRGVALDDPVLVVRQRGRLRTTALLGSGTWRWKNLPADLQPLSALWPGLFSNTSRWLTTPEDDRRVRVRPTEGVFDGGEPVQFSGQVYDESLQPLSDAAVEVAVTTPDGTRLPFTMDAVGNGRYVLVAGTLPEGTYRYTATARRGEAELGTDAGTFAVGGLTIEFKETRADADLMRQLAQRSGGALLMPAEAARLAELLQASGTFVPQVRERVQERKLWHMAWLLAVVLALLTAEWLLRKRSGMA